MARVVQHRNSPPYVLIVFIFLFLISTTMAVWKHMSADKQGAAADSLRKTRTRLVSNRELKDARTQKMMQVALKTKQSVVGQLQGQIAELTTIITGAPSTTDEAIRQANEIPVLLQSKLKLGLVPEVKRLKMVLDIKLDQINDLNDKLRQKDAVIATGQAALRQFSAEAQPTAALLMSRGRKAEMQLVAEQTSHQELRSRAQKASQEEIAARDKQIEERETDIQKLQIDLRNLETQINRKEGLIAQLERKIEKLEGRSKEPIRVVGKVYEEPRGDICYINVGKMHNIREGVTFAVYPAGTLTSETPRKGALIVRTVHDSISECRITKLDDKSVRIARGDQIANIAYGGRYTFVIAGLFDLHSTGVATAAGAEKVKMLIKRAGSKVVADVDHNVDHVVLGTVMMKPTEPEPSDPQHDWAVYRTKLEQYKRYNDVRIKATELKVNILNTNRFLDLMGVVQGKTLTYE